MGEKTARSNGFLIATALVAMFAAVLEIGHQIVVVILERNFPVTYDRFWFPLAIVIYQLLIYGAMALILIFFVKKSKRFFSAVGIAMILDTVILQILNLTLGHYPKITLIPFDFIFGTIIICHSWLPKRKFVLTIIEIVLLSWVILFTLINPSVIQTAKHFILDIRYGMTGFAIDRALQIVGLALNIVMQAFAVVALAILDKNEAKK